MFSSRRGFIGSLISFVAAPAIVRIDSIMPVSVIEEIEDFEDFDDLSLPRIPGGFTAQEIANIANASLDFYYRKGDIFAQAIQERPMLAERYPLATRYFDIGKSYHAFIHRPEARRFLT